MQRCTVATYPHDLQWRGQEQYEPALSHSEKALTILKVTLKNEPKELEPFLEDNRMIRERLVADDAHR